MIIYDCSEYSRYLGNIFNNFNSEKISGDIKVVIVDRYYGGVHSSNNKNIKGFLRFIKNLISNCEIIWFYDGTKTTKLYNDVQLVDKKIDYSKYGIDIHDRFLFIYDKKEKMRVQSLHLGASINNYSIKTSGQGNSVGIFRISNLIEDDEKKKDRGIEKLLKKLGNIYHQKYGQEMWCY